MKVLSALINAALLTGFLVTSNGHAAAIDVLVGDKDGLAFRRPVPIREHALG